MIAEYAMYKGDELLHIGTMDEIAKERGVQKRTIYFYSTQAYQNRLSKRRNAKNYITLTRLEDDE